MGDQAAMALADRSARPMKLLTTSSCAGTPHVDVVCPGFVADCLETLEEIAMEGQAAFKAAGGKEFGYVPCLNDDPTWMAALAEIVQEHLQGWPTQRRADDGEAAATRERARAKGAKS